MQNIQQTLKKYELKSSTLINKIKAITNSKYLDIIGLVIVLTASISLDYHKTEYQFSFNNTTYVFYLGF